MIISLEIQHSSELWSCIYLKSHPLLSSPITFCYYSIPSRFVGQGLAMWVNLKMTVLLFLPFSPIINASKILVYDICASGTAFEPLDHWSQHLCDVKKALNNSAIWRRGISLYSKEWRRRNSIKVNLPEDIMLFSTLNVEVSAILIINDL